MRRSNINIYQVHKLRQVFLGQRTEHAKTRVGGEQSNPQNSESLFFKINIPAKIENLHLLKGVLHLRYL